MLHKEIKDKYPNAKISSCNENECCLHIDKKNNLIMLKGECLPPKKIERRCDCIIFRDDGTIVMVELKSNTLDVDKINEKFVISGKQSLSIAKSIEPNKEFTLYFILLAKSYNHHSTYIKLCNTKIKINGNSYSLILENCGCSLSKLLHK